MNRFTRLDVEQAGAGDSLPCALPWVTGHLVDGGIRPGERTLIYGEQGVGKTTLLAQLALGFAKAGVKCLLLTTELSDLELLDRMQHVVWFPFGADPVYENTRIGEVDSLEHLEETAGAIAEGLGEFLPRIVILDSLQGLGLNAYQPKNWERVYKLLRRLKEAGVATFVVGHTIKNLQPAGPKSLEHEVDLILSMRKAGDRRLISVPKNRFGASRFAPLIFQVESVGELIPDKRTLMILVSKVLGFDSRLVQVEAKVDQTASGLFCSGRPILNGIKERHYDKVASVLADLRFDLMGMSNSVACNIPGENPRYSPSLDLAVAMALISSHIQRPVSPWAAFIGELGLDGVVMDEFEPSLLRSLALELERAKRDGRRLTVFVPPRLCMALGGAVDLPEKISLVPVLDIRNAFSMVWPDIKIPVK